MDHPRPNQGRPSNKGFFRFLYATRRRNRRNTKSDVETPQISVALPTESLPPVSAATSAITTEADPAFPNSQASHGLPTPGGQPSEPQAGGLSDVGLTRSDTLPAESTTPSRNLTESTLSSLHIQFCQGLGQANLTDEPLGMSDPALTMTSITEAGESTPSAETPQVTQTNTARSSRFASLPDEILLSIMGFCDDYDSVFSSFKGNSGMLRFRHLGNKALVRLVDDGFCHWNVFDFNSGRRRSSTPVNLSDSETHTDLFPNLKNLHKAALDRFFGGNQNHIGKALSFHIRDWLDWTFAESDVLQHMSLALQAIPRCYSVNISLPDPGHVSIQNSTFSITSINNRAGSLPALFAALHLHEDVTAFSWTWPNGSLASIPDFFNTSSSQPAPSPSAWSQLNTLTIDCPLALDECFDAMREFKNSLEVASFGITSDAPITIPAEPILLARLHALKLVLENSTTNAAASLFDDTTIDTPALKVLDLRSRQQFLENAQFRPSWKNLESLKMSDTALIDGWRILEACINIHDLSWSGSPIDSPGRAAQGFSFPDVQLPFLRKCTLPPPSPANNDFSSVHVSFERANDCIKFVFG